MNDAGCRIYVLEEGEEKGTSNSIDTHSYILAAGKNGRFRANYSALPPAFSFLQLAIKWQRRRAGRSDYSHHFLVDSSSERQHAHTQSKTA